MLLLRLSPPGTTRRPAHRNKKRLSLPLSRRAHSETSQVPPDSLPAAAGLAGLAAAAGLLLLDRE